MENAIPAVVIAGILITAAALLGHATNTSVDNVGGAWRDMEAVSELRLGTDLAVVSSQIDVDNDTITVTLLNEGSTAINDYALMDVIANYDGASGRYSVWLPYTEDAPQPGNTWTVTAIANDVKDPGIFNTGEELTLTIEVDPAVAATTNRWLSLAAATGVTYTVYF
jgi:archaellum component FlaF (FlaF/FlaG flagellin family)